MTSAHVRPETLAVADERTWQRGSVLHVSMADPGQPHPSHESLVTYGRTAAFLEGALDDREALALALDADADTCSDTDLLLRLYARWGADGLARLRGSFAFALIDRSTGEAYAGRDPVGHHPLFSAETAGRWLLSTSQRALLGTPGVSAAINRVALADRLCQRFIDPDETCFLATRRVHPASFMRVAHGTITSHRHWDPARQSAPVRTDYPEAFEEAFDRAVRRCLAADARAGVFLSGGLDSISVAAVAVAQARAQGRPSPQALSVGFPDPSCDERLTQQAVAADLGLPMTFLDFYEALPQPGGLLRASVALNETLGAPLLNAWAPLYLSLARRAAQSGVRTILTGGGGDEWLTTSPYLAADLLRAGHIRRLAAHVRVWQRSSRTLSVRAGFPTAWRFGVRPLIGAGLSRAAPAAWDRHRLRRWLSADPDWVAPDAALRAEQRERAARALCDPRPKDGFYAREMRTGLDHHLVLHEHDELFRWSELTGTSIRHPYWDADLVSLLYTMPPEALNAAGRTKGLIRTALAKRLPTLGLDRQRKVKSASFFAKLVAGEAPELLDRFGSLEGLASLGVVDPRRGRAALANALASSGRAPAVAWTAINVESWARTHL